MTVNPPKRIRADHNLPAGPLHVVGVWAMPGHGVDIIGVWLAQHPANVPGKRYPVTRVSREEVKAWEQ